MSEPEVFRLVGSIAETVLKFEQVWATSSSEAMCDSSEVAKKDLLSSNAGVKMAEMC